MKPIDKRAWAARAMAVFSLLAMGAHAVSAAQPGQYSLAHLPLGFEPGVRQSEFVAHAPGFSVVLTSDRVSIGAGEMRLSGARKTVGQPEEITTGYTNYLVDSDSRKWRTRVPNYRRVRYSGVYPGIDVVYYGNPSELEFDFIVAPGADPRRIQLEVSSPDLRIRLPRIYQSGRSIKGRAVRRGGRIRFEIAGYDHSQPLVIDPVLSYASIFGGGSYDQGTAIAVDSNGAVYVTGNTGSPNFPANNYQPGRSAFLVKLNAEGTALVYATFLPVSGVQRAAVSPSGDAYVASQFVSADTPVIGPAPLGNCSSVGPNLYFARLSPDGASLVYSGCLPGSAYAQIAGMAVDSAGNAFVTGFTQSSGFPILNALQPTHPDGPPTGFLLKLRGNGALLFSTFLGGTGGDSPRAIAVDSTGNVYVTGQTSSGDFPLKNALETRLSGYSAFVVKVKADGSDLIYSTYFGGSNGDSAMTIAADAMGNAYLAGTTLSGDFPVSGNAFQPHLNGAFAFKTTDGGAIWTKSDSGLPGPASRVQVDPNNPSIVYALAGSVGTLFKSSDGGVTWRATSATGAGSLWISPADSTLYVQSGTGLLRSANAGATFTAANPGPAAGLNELAFDPGNTVMYGRWGASGAGDGVYKSIDGGDTWNATGLTGSALGRGGLAVDPAHPSTLYATSNRMGLLQSDDGGDTWKVIDSGITFSELQVDSASRLFALSGNTILVRSGNTVLRKVLPTTATVNHLVVDPANSATWYGLCNGAGVFKSTDSGDTWQAVNSGLPGPLFVQSIALDPKSPSTLYLAMTPPPDGFFAKLSADGSSLLYATYLGGTGTESVNAIAADAGGNVYLAGTTDSTDFPMQAAFRTSGSGFVTKFDSKGALSWSSSLGEATPLAIALGPTGEVYLTGDSSSTTFPTANSIKQYTSGNVFRTSDGGTTWTGVTLPTTYTFGSPAVAVDPAAPSHLVAVFDRLYSSDDSGQNWKPLGDPGFIPISQLTMAVDPLNPQTIYVAGYPHGAGNGGVSRTMDGGATWVAAPVETGPASDVVYGLAIDPKTPSTLYAAVYFSGMYKSVDSGASWNPAGTLPYPAAVAVDARNPALVYASAGTDFPQPASSGSIYRSQDGGQSWTAINNGLQANFYANILIADPATPARVYAAKSFYGGGIYRSDDFGNSWTAIGTGLPDQVLKVLAIDPSHPSTLYAGPSSGGLYRSLDAGATWKMAPGFGLPVVGSIAIDPTNSSRIYVGAQIEPGDAFVMKIAQ